MGLRKKIKKFIYNSNINRKYGKFSTAKTIKKLGKSLSRDLRNGHEFQKGHNNK